MPVKPSKPVAEKAPHCSQSVSLRVYRVDLKSAIDDGLPKLNWWARRSLFRTRKRIEVEGAPAFLSDSVFYAPDASKSVRTPLQHVKTAADECRDTLVRPDDDFEISFAGMSVPSYDFLPSNRNELLLYSGARDAINASAMMPSPRDCRGKEENQPFIHYDYVVDAHDEGSRPNTFVPIPASKAVYYRNRRPRRIEQEDGPDELRIKFSLLEIDELKNGQVQAMLGIEAIANSAQQTSALFPFVGLVSIALHAASAIGKRGLRKRSRPDHVMSKDVQFILKDKADDEDVSGLESSLKGFRRDRYRNYLRYGYYVFLDKPVDARLYVQTGASSQNASILLRRHNFKEGVKVSNEKEFFPLTGISYVVVQVVRGCTEQGVNRRARDSHHTKRLQMLVAPNHATGMAFGV